jgi:hypothetical protein
MISRVTANAVVSQFAVGDQIIRADQIAGVDVALRYKFVDVYPTA